MFIRPCYRKKNGKRHAYWALVESCRTERGPRQRIVGYLGGLPEKPRRKVKIAVSGNRAEEHGSLFPGVNESEYSGVKTTFFEKCKFVV